MTLLVALLAGAVIGLLLGALGGGGSILTVPVLVYALGESTSVATTASLIIVGITAVVGVAEHHRCGRVRWGPGLTFGLVGSVTAVAGTWLGQRVPAQALLLGFSALMVLAAVGLVRRVGSDRSDDGPEAVGPPGGVVVTAVRRATPTRRRVAVVAAALGVGLLTGFFGVGGGFVIVPALILALDLPMSVAAATSLVVIALNSGAGLIARWGQIEVPWGVVVPFTLAAVAFSLVGGRAAQHIPQRRLSLGFAVLLVVVAGYVGLRASGLVQ